MTTELSQSVKDAARAEGFDLCGVAGVPRDGMPELEYFAEWVERGHAGEMEYLKSRNEAGELKRSSLQAAAPWAKSVIVCAINYNTSAPYSTEVGDATRGWIARYALGGGAAPVDYHDVILPRLRRIETKLKEASGTADFRSWCYVDTGPVVERVFARYAGIGWTGKNTCTINQQLGSWLFLGVILTSVELQPDMPAADRCGSCTRCIEACPTQAIIEPFKLDASRCIAYLTIEKRGAIPEEMRAGIGRHVFGCDICQDVCPWNRKAPASTLPEFAAREDLVNPALEWLAEMSAEDFRRLFKGSPLQRTKLAGLRRNAVVAMGNSGDAKFVPMLERLTEDEDANVAEHARWALRELGGR